MANEKIDSLETKLNDVLSSLKTLTDALTNGKMEERAEAHILNEKIEGESSHSLHLFGNHQQSQT